MTRRSPEKIDHFGMVSVSVVMERAALTAAQVRRAYEANIELWEELGVPPTIWSVGRGTPTVWKRGRDHRRARNGIETAGFESDLAGISLGRMLPQHDSPDQQMTMFALQRRDINGVRCSWDCFAGLLPTAIGVSELEAENRLLALIALISGNYGYVIHMKGTPVGPFFYASGIIGGGEFDPATQDEHCANINRWQPDTAALERVLRDLYAINLLTQHYLDLPFGDSGLTLQRWIERDHATRGALEPLAGAEQVTVWRPVIANIPRLREELFRAGLLFYWRHFDPTQPEFRDFSKPFVPPDQSPAIFRPEFYAGRDPKVTR